jgi:hypothetical protein
MMRRINLQLFAQKLNTKTSVVDLLKSQGKDSSYEARKKLAQEYGIENYRGTGEQNKQLREILSGTPSVSNTGKVAGGSTKKNTSNINGVDASVVDKINSSFSESATVKNAKKGADAQLANVVQLGNQKDIVDQSTWDAINTPFSASSAYVEAMNYTNSLLEKLSSGRTSYTDRINEMMDKIQNREDFSYDVESDTLFQQSLASAMASGKTAMQDTIGQASAMTGGYGSTYATTAGNQAYNAYIQDAYENLPEYYQMAMEAYQMEGQEMYNQLGMLNNADATEYERNYNAWNANFSNAQQMYAQEYGRWQDSVNNAYNSANLQMQESGQLFDQAYNTYNAVQNDASTKYAQEYQKWADEVNNALNYAQMQNSDYWNTKEFNESQRQFDASMAMDDAQFKASMAQDQAQFNAQMAYKQVSQTASNKKVDEDGNEIDEPSQSQMQKALEAYNTGGDGALSQYVDSLPSNIDIDKIADYVYGGGTASGYGTLPLEQRTFTKTKDTINGLWGVDRNDVVVDQYGNEYKIKELPENIRKSLTKLKKGESYTAK